jgi:hypothetical protein
MPDGHGAGQGRTAHRPVLCSRAEEARGGIYDGAMPMREDCRHFESRTYANGDTVRKCDLDLAPEAPWRCPDDCAQYARRRADVAWQYGTAVAPPTPVEPDSVGEDDSVARLLDEAEDIINAAGPSIMAEVADERGRAGRSLFGRMKDRFRRKR